MNTYKQSLLYCFYIQGYYKNCSKDLYFSPASLYRGLFHWLYTPTLHYLYIVVSIPTSMGDFTWGYLPSGGLLWRKTKK